MAAQQAFLFANCSEPLEWKAFIIVAAMDHDWEWLQELCNRLRNLIYSP